MSAVSEDQRLREEIAAEIRPFFQAFYEADTDNALERLTDIVETRLSSLSEGLKAAVLHERESCAFLAEQHSGMWDQATVDQIAENIRARGDCPDDPVHVTRERYAELVAVEQSLKAAEEQLGKEKEDANVACWSLLSRALAAEAALKAAEDERDEARGHEKRLRAEKVSQLCDAVCDSYADENQRLFDRAITAEAETARLRDEIARMEMGEGY